MTFAVDVFDGEAVELRFMAKIKRGYVFIHKMEGEFKPFDIVAIDDEGEIKTFEIKCDRKWEETGNVAIEIAYKGKPSGITTSKSDFYIYYLYPFGFYWIRTQELKDYLHSKKLFYKLVKGGDDNQSEMILLPLSTFKVLFNGL